MKSAGWKSAAGAALLAALLAGCSAGNPERRAEPRVNLSGYSQSFKHGYADGCESAGWRGRQRDDRRYKADADYKMGWDDGHSVCRR